MLDHLSPSRLRANLYRILDRILETGEPVEIRRKGKKLHIVPEHPGKLAQLKPHPDYLNCSPDDIVHLDWSTEWRP